MSTLYLSRLELSRRCTRSRLGPFGSHVAMCPHHSDGSGLSDRIPSALVAARSETVVCRGL